MDRLSLFHLIHQNGASAAKGLRNTAVHSSRGGLLPTPVPGCANTTLPFSTCSPVMDLLRRRVGGGCGSSPLCRPGTREALALQLLLAWISSAWLDGTASAESSRSCICCSVILWNGRRACRAWCVISRSIYVAKQSFDSRSSSKTNRGNAITTTGVAVFAEKLSNGLP